MSDARTLADYLSRWAAASAERRAYADAILAVAAAAIDTADVIRQGPLAGALGAPTARAPCDRSATADQPKLLDVLAHDRLAAALRAAGVAVIASEESQHPEVFDAGGLAAVAFDPLDGSSNIDTNVSIGTIFSILPVPALSDGGAAAAFRQPGSMQCAAGYVIYGPHVALVMSVGEGTLEFTLDGRSGAFVCVGRPIAIPPQTREYAINASNYRHWNEEIRAYVDDCIAGADGPRGTDCNMRWIASLVAETHRVLMRGGVFLYPRDDRKGYENGRLRLLYEANPIAFLIEEAGGKAVDGDARILDIVPRSLHQRTPLMFGSVGEIDSLRRYRGQPYTSFERSPLFGRRGLLKS